MEVTEVSIPDVVGNKLDGHVRLVRVPTDREMTVGDLIYVLERYDAHLLGTCKIDGKRALVLRSDTFEILNLIESAELVILPEIDWANVVYRGHG